MLPLYKTYWKITVFVSLIISSRGFPGASASKEPFCQCRRCKICGFSLWVRKFLRRRKWQPALEFLPGKSHGDFQEPGRLESMGSQRVKQEWTHVCKHIHHLLKEYCFNYYKKSVQFSHIQLSATTWTTACQSSLSITNLRSLLKFMSIT